MSQSRIAPYAIGFIFGAALGSALALLLAPARGEETRQRLRSRSLDLAGQGRETAQRVLARSKEAAAQGRAGLTSTVEKLKSRLSRAEASGESPSEGEVTSP